MENAVQLFLLGGAAFVAGLINSIAGGGSLISFPALVAFGQPPVIANATNTASVWPGTISSSYAYRKEFPRDKSLVIPMVLTSVAGGILGAAILVGTPSRYFQLAVPFLVLFATSLFALRSQVSRLSKKLLAMGPGAGGKGRIAGYLFQFLVATYGGYFGAGIGIIMLASFSLMGVGEIHRMNALKTVLASILNGVALFYFAYAGLIVWPLAIGMGVCATTGGYVGASVAQKLPAVLVQRTVVVLGYLAALWLFHKSYGLF